MSGIFDTSRLQRGWLPQAYIRGGTGASMMGLGQRQVDLLARSATPTLFFALFLSSPSYFSIFLSCSSHYLPSSLISSRT